MTVLRYGVAHSIILRRGHIISSAALRKPLTTPGLSGLFSTAAYCPSCGRKVPPRSPSQTQLFKQESLEPIAVAITRTIGDCQRWHPESLGSLLFRRFWWTWRSRPLRNAVGPRGPPLNMRKGSLPDTSESDTRREGSQSVGRTQWTPHRFVP